MEQPNDADLTPRPQHPTLHLSAEEQELYELLGAPRSHCPPMEVIRALHQEVLPPEVEEAALRHLATCSLCEDLTASLDAAQDDGFGPPEMTALADNRIRKRLGLPINASEVRPGLWRRRLLAVAAALLVLAGGFAVWHSHRSPAWSPTPELTSIPRPVATVAHLDIPFTPLQPPSDTAPLATRGDAGPEPSVEELLPAFRAYNQADYAGAARAFERIGPRHPSSVLIPLYLGVSQLALAQNQPARTNLQHALDQARARSSAGASAQVDEARWYLAIAAARLHSKEALTLLKMLCAERSSAYSPQSCTLLMESAR